MYFVESLSIDKCFTKDVCQFRLRELNILGRLCASFDKGDNFGSKEKKKKYNSKRIPEWEGAAGKESCHMAILNHFVGRYILTSWNTSSVLFLLDDTSGLTGQMLKIFYYPVCTCKQLHRWLDLFHKEVTHHRVEIHAETQCNIE